MLSALALFGVKSAAILVVVALACRLFHRLGASYRHLFWTAGFCAILVLPILSAVLPRQNVAILPAPVSEDALPRFAAATHAARDMFPLPNENLARTPVPSLTKSPFTLRPEQTLPRITSAKPPARQSGPYAIILSIWLTGVMVVLGQHTLSLLLLSKSATKAAKADASLYGEMMHFSRKWNLLLGDVAGMPSPKTWGVFRPVVAMPAKSSEWPAEQFRTVLMHELIHVQRLDFLTQSLATLACALNWCNPMAWLALRAMRVEAENAADDAVLLAGVKPSVYAQAQLQAASEFQSPNSPFLSAGVPLMKQSKIEARVRAILSTGRQVRRINRLGAMALIGVSLLVAAPCAALQATSQTPAAEKLAAERDGAARQPVSGALAYKAHSAEQARKKSAERHTNASADQLRKYQAEIEELRRQLAQQRREMTFMRLSIESEYRERLIAKADAKASRRAEEQANFEQAKANVAAAQAQVESLQAKITSEKAWIPKAEARYKAGIDTEYAYQVAVEEAKSNDAGLKAAQAVYQAAQAKLDAEKAAAEAYKEPERQREMNSLRGSLQASEAEMNALRAKMEQDKALALHGLKSQRQSQEEQEKLRKALAEVEALNVKLRALFDKSK